MLNTTVISVIRIIGKMIFEVEFFRNAIPGHIGKKNEKSSQNAILTSLIIEEYYIISN